MKSLFGRNINILRGAKEVFCRSRLLQLVCCPYSILGPLPDSFSMSVGVIAPQFVHGLLNSPNMGRRGLFSNRARYDVIEFSNCCTEEPSEAEFFCAV